MLVPPLRLLIDAGEGVSTCLGARIFGIETVIITHEHLDHISGLLSFLGHRRSIKGAKEKPLEIICGSQAVKDKIQIMVDLVKNSCNSFYPIEIRLAQVGVPIKLKGYWVELFKTNHCYGSYGVMIYQKTKRLKEVFRQSEKFIGDIKSGKQKVTPQHQEDHFIPIIVYALDNNGLDFKENTFIPVRPRLLVDDLTFPEGFPEASNPRHNDLNGLVRNVLLLKPEKVLATHVSSRIKAGVKESDKEFFSRILKQFRIEIRKQGLKERVSFLLQVQKNTPKPHFIEVKF